MFTSTYLPHVGGVARAVRTARDVLRARGHRVTVVAPMCGISDDEDDILRVPAVDVKDGFSLPLALPQLATMVAPVVIGAAVVHVHHPLLLGLVGRDIAKRLGKPVIYTYHTMYENYAHLLPTDRQTTASVLVHQAAEFCNSCNAIIAPSEDVKRVLRSRGVRKLIAVLPTGIDTSRFANGNGAAARQRYGIQPDEFIIGCVCRLSPEKNIGVLAQAAAAYPTTTFLVVGDGTEREQLRLPNVRLTGNLRGQELIDAYHAMNVFAYPSVSETQGLVLAEALAAGVPVCAINSPGVNDVIRDRMNGCLTYGADEFVRRIPEAASYQPAAQSSAIPFSLEVFVGRLEKLYRLVGGPFQR